MLGASVTRSAGTRSSSEADPVQAALDFETERLLVETHHGRLISHPQHDMVDSFDMESHGV